MVFVACVCGLSKRIWARGIDAGTLRGAKGTSQGGQLPESHAERQGMQAGGGQQGSQDD